MPGDIIASENFDENRDLGTIANLIVNDVRTSFKSMKFSIKTIKKYRAIVLTIKQNEYNGITFYYGNTLEKTDEGEKIVNEIIKLSLQYNKIDLYLRQQFFYFVVDVKGFHYKSDEEYIKEYGD